jgi:uncharacterized YceG family protein
MSPLFGRGGDNRERRNRSEEEREGARLERERRRAAREGRPPPEELAPAAPPTEEWLAPEVEPIEEAPAPDAEPTAPADAQPTAPAEAEPHAPADAEPTAPAPPSTADPLSWDDPVPSVTVRRVSEEPLGTKRVAASQVATAAGAEAPPRFGAPPRGRPRGRRGLRRAGPLLILLAGVFLLWFVVSLFQPFKGDGSGNVRITIPAGAGTGDIADLLAEKDVVGSSFFFSLRARLSGDRGRLRAGTYTLKRDMSYSAALGALTKAPGKATTVSITVPEGRSISETIPLVRKAGLRGGYTKAARSRRLLADVGAPRRVKTLEGYLWPSTYELKAGTGADGLVQKQVAEFKRNFAKVDLSYAKRKNLTTYDVLIIASMIEREAGVDKDRALISAVIYNRLHERMQLGIDATTRYELENWVRPLRSSDFKSNSPYNTRVHLGLPPTPIGNPGLPSIQAAAHPARVSYLYYVVKPCGNGEHAFSSTDAKFQSDVRKYNAARDERGGQDPSRC